MTDATSDLQRLLKAKSAAARESALQAGGAVSREQMAEIEQLSRLLELERSGQPAPPKRAWLLAALLGGTLIVVSVLLFARVRETAIELEVDASQVSFELKDEQILLEHVSLERLGAAGLSRIELPESLAATEDAGESLQAIAIASAQDGDRQGSIDITHVAPAAGTGVTIQRSGVANEYRVSLIEPKMVINVGVLGPVRLSSTGPEFIDFANPRAILLRAPSGVIDLDLTFRDVSDSGVIPQIPVQKLVFARIVDHSADVAITRRLSTINRGTLYFQSLKGEQRALRAGEALRFSEARGEIRALRLGNDQLSLNFQGRVRGMVTGSQDNPQNLMPTWLEWLKAQHGLSLLWGSTFYLFGLAITVSRWLKGS